MFVFGKSISKRKHKKGVNNDYLWGEGFRKQEETFSTVHFCII